MSTTYTLKLISWNVRARVKEAVLRQVEALRNQQPQIVALQDVNMNSVQLYQKYFERIGLPHIAHTFQSHPEKSPSGVLIASCFELDPFPTAQSSKIWPTGTYSPDNDIVVKHWNKRTLFVTLNSSWGKIARLQTPVRPCLCIKDVAPKRCKVSPRYPQA